MLNSIILLGGLVSAFGLGAINPIQEKQDNVQFKLENHKSVSYDDEEFEITLSADELNNYHWDNLCSFIDGLTNGTYFNGSEGTYLDYTFSEFEFYPSDYVGWTFVENYSINLFFNELNASEGYYQKFGLSDENGDFVLFEGSFTWLVAGGYSEVKQAIELDIQANSQDINGNIFETLTDSVVAFVGSLGSGIVSMTNIFYDSVNNQLTAIGLLSVIVVAVSLTYFLFRLIIGLIRMRG